MASSSICCIRTVALDLHSTISDSKLHAFGMRRLLLHTQMPTLLYMWLLVLLIMPRYGTWRAARYNADKHVGETSDGVGQDVSHLD